MPSILESTLKQYQNHTFRYSNDLRLQTSRQAVDFVNERGFIFFWPFKGVRFPSLWGAVAGDRPVADEHDDPGHITWNWKDTLLDQRVWYYARVIKKKNTMVSLETIPYFYALSPNYGEPEEDLLDQYNQGLLPLEARLVFEALLKKGPLDTISLRKESHLTGAASQSPFNRALEILQGQLKVLPVSVSEAGAWGYAFVYDLTHRYYPELPENARSISETSAMDHLLLRYFKSLGAAKAREASSFFKWSSMQVERSLQRLVGRKELVGNVQIENRSGEYFALPDLAN